VEFDECAFACFVDKPERMDAKTIHEAEGARNCPIRHHPHDHVHGFRGEAYEIPKIVMRRLGLGKSAIGFLLGGMYEVRKLYSVLNEEDRDIVCNHIPITFFGVELDREASYVARKIGRPLVARHSRKTDEHGGLLADFGQHFRSGIIGETFIEPESSMHAEASCVYDTLRDALMVEMKDFLAKMKILEERWAPFTDLQTVLVVRDRNALLRC